MPREALNGWLLAMIRATVDGPRRICLAGLLHEAGFTEKVDPATRLALVLSMDLADRDQAVRVSWFLQEQAKALRTASNSASAKLITEVALKREAARRDSADWEDDEMLRTLMLVLPAQERIDFVARLAALIGTSPAAKHAKERFDDRLLGLFLAEIRRAPERTYLPALAAIDLSFIPGVNQSAVETRVEVLDAGLAIAHADPSSAGEVYASLKRWIRDEKMFDPDIVISLSSESPTSMQERWKSVLKQFKALAKH